MPFKLDENPNLKPIVGDATFKSKEQTLDTVMKLNWESPDVVMGKAPYYEEIRLQEFTKVISNSKKDDTTDSPEKNGKKKNSKINLSEYNRFSMIDDENEIAICKDDFDKNTENTCQTETVNTAALNTMFSFCKTKVLSAPNITENDNISLDYNGKINKRCNTVKDNSCIPNGSFIGHKVDSNISNEKQILASQSKENSSENKSFSENKEVNRNMEKITHLHEETHVCEEEFFQLTEDYHNLNYKPLNFGTERMADTDILDKKISPECSIDETVMQDGKEMKSKIPAHEEEWNIDSLVFYEDLYPQKSKNILFHFPKARETFETIRSQALRSFRSLTSEFQRINKRLNSKDQEFNKQKCTLGSLNQEMGDKNITGESPEVRENIGSVTSANSTATKVRNVMPCSSNKSTVEQISIPSWDDLHFLGEQMPERKNVSGTIMDFGRNARTTVRHWYSTRKKTSVN